MTADDSGTFTALGYRQTLVSAAKGGKANMNGFRFRTGGMRAFARTFRGNSFVSGHDWGDVRARAGTIEDAWAEEMPGDIEMGIYFDLTAKAPWAVEGLKNGTIDRFSIGASRGTEITCTVHNVPVWSISECWCFPGETVLDEDGNEVVAEWEHDGSRGLELSAVNVPAVDGTSIVNAIGHGRAAQRADLIAVGSTAEREALAEMCGRTKPWDRRPGKRVQVAVQQGGSTPVIANPTMASHAEDSMDRALICKTLGLPADATDEQILAKMTANGQNAAQVEVLRAQLADVSEQRQAEQDAAHVQAEITKLRASHVVSDKVVASLNKIAKEHGRAAFDTNLATVRESAPEQTQQAQQRPVLQSDEKPATNPGGTGVMLDGTGTDAYESNRANPELHRMMKAAQISVEDVRKHGSRTFNVQTDLAELSKRTDARSTRDGIAAFGK